MVNESLILSLSLFFGSIWTQTDGISDQSSVCKTDFPWFPHMLSFFAKNKVVSYISTQTQMTNDSSGDSYEETS
jgi:hypothetical protein